MKGQTELEDPLLIETADENRRRCGGRTTRGVRCRRTRPRWDTSMEAWFCAQHR